MSRTSPPERQTSVADGERTRAWAATMGGHQLAPGHADEPGVRSAHAGGTLRIGQAAGASQASAPANRDAREQAEHAWMAPGATRSEGAATGDDRRGPTPSAPASSATGTAFSIPPPSAAWLERPRCSSSLTIINAPA